MRAKPPHRRVFMQQRLPPVSGRQSGTSRRSPPTTNSRASRWSGVSGPTSSGATMRPSNGTRSSVLGSTCSIPSTCTAGKTICSGAGIRPIRSSPWPWPITPSRRAASPATTASPSESHCQVGLDTRPGLTRPRRRYFCEVGISYTCLSLSPVPLARGRRGRPESSRLSR